MISAPRAAALAVALLAALSGLGAGCATPPAPLPAVAPAADEDESTGPPFLVQAAMWIPNRVLDALEIVRLGVGVGPGIGVDLRATELGQLSAMSGFGAGIGWQGRWHPPVLLDSRAFVAAGPLTIGATSSNPLTSWRRTFWELRVEAHAAIALAEVAVDLAEVWDFLAGIVFVDPARDDILGPHWL